MEFKSREHKGINGRNLLNDKTGDGSSFEDPLLSLA